MPRRVLIPAAAACAAILALSGCSLIKDLLHPKSDDASLASLGVDKGTLTPSFSPSILDYSVEVSGSDDSVLVSAVPSDSVAKVSGAGSVALDLGRTLVEVLVTAEDGSKRTYTIAVTRPATIGVWATEEADYGIIAWLGGVASAYEAAHPGITIAIVEKATASIVADFAAAKAGGTAPEMLYAADYRIASIAQAGGVQAVDTGVFDPAEYCDMVRIGSARYGVPLLIGNQLMLYYNKSLVSAPPADTEALAASGSLLLAAGKVPLVYDTAQSFYLIPWLGAYGGSAFAADGVTPTLDTQAMRNALGLLKGWSDSGLAPRRDPADGTTAMDQTLARSKFCAGTAAMLICGDWAYGDIAVKMGDDLGLATLPAVTGASAAMPYTTAKAFAFCSSLSGSLLARAEDFALLATSHQDQLSMAAAVGQVPGLLAAASDPSLTATVAVYAAQVAAGTPMPLVREIWPVWDALQAHFSAVLDGTETAAAASAAMQADAAAEIAALP